MQAIASTPRPPYYAVIAPTVLNDDTSGYADTAAALFAAAHEIDGFLGIESCVQGRFVLAVSYWRSLDAIEAWRRHAAHGVAKATARSRWFASYFTRIARVERDY